MTRVLVGLSGGVDSSAVVELLREEGLEVTACVLTMQTAPVAVPTAEALERARALCAERGVPLVEVDVAERFAAAVVDPFVAEYACGRTPNPCVVCNAAVKFAALAAEADRLGCELVATGHYAGVERAAGGTPRVVRGADAGKDQSYFMYRLPPELVGRCRFPLGAQTKERTRAFARDRGLAAAEAPDSTGVCFAPGGDYHLTMAERAPELLNPGPIYAEDGTYLGEHRGIACYTLGQRKGLGLSGGPWFITRIDAAANALTVAQGTPPRARSFTLRMPVLWRAMPSEGLRCLAQTHYRAHPVSAQVTRAGDRLRVELEGAGTLAADGQSCVLYEGDAVIGGGFIALDNTCAGTDADRAPAGEKGQSV